MRRLTFTILFGNWLIACVSPSYFEREDLNVSLGKGVEFKLLSPESFGRNVSFTQTAEIETINKVYDLIFQVQLMNDQLTVAGLLPNGTRILLITFNGDKIRSSGNEDVIRNISPKHLIADLQLSMWPYSTLSSALTWPTSCSDNITCSFSENLDLENRKLTIDGETIISISYGPFFVENTNIVYTHILRQYKIHLGTIEMHELD